MADVEAVGVEADYVAFAPQSEALTGPVVPYAGYSGIALQNVQVGLAAVLVDEERLRRELPALDLTKLKEMRGLASALDFAARKVDRTLKRTWSKEELLRRQSDISDHRRVLLLAAEALAAAGKLPADEVTRIRKGRGFIDAANDCVDLVALFRAHASTVQSTVPFEWSRLTAAAAAGSEMVAYLRPAGSTVETPLSAEQLRDIRIRDGLYTLLARRYDELLFRAGAWLFGVAVSEKVPPLLSRATR